MSICEKNREFLALFSAGLDMAEGFDFAHARSCSSCAAELKEARLLRRLLTAYSAEMDEAAAGQLAKADLISAMRLEQPVRKSYWARWSGVAASLVLAFFLGRWAAQDSPSPAFEADDLIAAISRQSAREEVKRYLDRTQLFLIYLMQPSEECGGDDQKRSIAEKLIYQKRLLEPQLASETFQDLEPLLDELEFLFLDVADGEGCFKPEEYELWEGYLNSRSTFMKLNLLQVKDRI